VLQLPLGGVETQLMITGHPRITLLEPTDRFADGHLLDQYERHRMTRDKAYVVSE